MINIYDKPQTQKHKNKMTTMTEING